MTSVSSFRTTLTDRGTWPVLCCSKALAAWAICCAAIESGLSMKLVLRQRQRYGIAAGIKKPTR